MPRIHRYAWFAVRALGAGACGESSARSRLQRSPLPAPDGRFVADVAVQTVAGRDFERYWIPVIRRADGEVVFRDAEGFPGRFSVDWRWDADGNLWVYDSDDGQHTCDARRPGPDGPSFERIGGDALGGASPPRELSREAIYGD